MLRSTATRRSAFIGVPLIAALLLSTVSTVASVHEFSTTNQTAINAVHTNARMAFAVKAELLAIAEQIEAHVAVAEGKVLDERILHDELARATAFRAAAAELHQSGVAGEAAIDAGRVVGAAWYWQYEAAIEQLNAVDFDAGTRNASTLMDSHSDHGDVITAAVEAWETEQTRIEVEKERAAKLRAEQARIEAANRALAKSAAPSPGFYAVYVRTVANASNAQSTIDAGGQVAVDYGDGSGILVSAHNTSDSTALRLKAGDIVRFSGAATGTYRVTGSKDVKKYGSTTADVRSLGVSMMMQTCYFGTDLMRVVGMVKQ